MSQEFIIYADESEKRGPYFSNFYGGALVRSIHLEEVIEALEQKKQELYFKGEVKWSKVSANYLDKYRSLIDIFFLFIQQDKVKVRIMFTQNINVPLGLTEDHISKEYFYLYYQFIKHSFGLIYCEDTRRPINMRLYLDRISDTKEQIKEFRRYVSQLTHQPDFLHKEINIPLDQITEVDSKDHVILQCLDIVLGSMQFRLNNLHKVKPEGSRNRGKKTIAKEKLYHHIYKNICYIHPHHFNIGMSTSIQDDVRNRWLHSYRHWLFIPTNSQQDLSWSKKIKKE